MATRPEKVDEWTRIVIKAGEALLSFKVDSWQNGVNRNVEGRTVRRVLGYNGNGAHFRRTIWRPLYSPSLTRLPEAVVHPPDLVLRTNGNANSR